METKPEEKHSNKCKHYAYTGRKDLYEVPTCDCDGYHTFDELYEHRIALYIALCKRIKDTGDDIYVWRSKNHSDGEHVFGGTWFVLGLQVEKGEQITYHLPMGKWAETDFANTLEKAPEFDGHTSDDVLLRLKNLTR